MPRGHLRTRIYDAAILSLTTSWYAEVLDRLPHAARVLDVGIGTGGALVANAPRLEEKDLHITGIDVDPAYVERCRDLVARRGLTRRVDVRLESVYDHRGGPYDAIYFSASFMLLPDPRAALDHVREILAPGGRLYFTQTFENRRSPLIERVKPLLRLLTTIDFGRVTYEDDFRSDLLSAGLDLVEMQKLGGTRARSYHLAIARP